MLYGWFGKAGDKWVGDERRSSESGFSDDLLTLGGFVGEAHATDCVASTRE